MPARLSTWLPTRRLRGGCASDRRDVRAGCQIVQKNGNFRYVLRGAGDVGVDRTTGLPTDVYTVIGKPDGSVLTMFPGTTDWIALQSNDFRAGVKVVAIDPSAPYAAAIRRSLPDARIVVDQFHLVLLANAMVTDVRQRLSHQQHQRRGRKVDAAWAHRRLLLRAGNKLSPAALGRLSAVLEGDDPSNEIGAAWAIKELLRQLLAGNGPARSCRATVSHRRTRFLTACVRGSQPGHKAVQACRLQVPQPSQRRKAHHVAQRDPLGRVSPSSRGGHPAEVRRAGNPASRQWPGARHEGKSVLPAPCDGSALALDLPGGPARRGLNAPHR